jgi:hypothetical protein
MDLSESGNEEIPDPWLSLSPALRSSGDELAKLALSGDLALSVGAGVSTSAGLPNWKSLIHKLAEKANMSEDETRMLDSFDLLDAASIVEQRFIAAGEDLKHKIASMLRLHRYTLLHGLIAALPVKEVVTTNYDDMAEQAGEAMGNPYAVLPSEVFVGTRRRWLLKLHGCVRHPASIVLTRQDYMRYNDTRGALAGTVHALLLTHHLLFLGFSLTDENFHRILDTVRKARDGAGAEGGPGEAPAVFGTRVVLRASELHSELWRRDLDTVCMAGACEGASTPECARRLEVLMDWVVAKSRPLTSYLLAPECEHLLSGAERRACGAVREFVNKAPAQLFDMPVYHDVLSTLEALGDRDLRAKADRLASCALLDTPGAESEGHVFVLQGDADKLKP